MKVPAYQKLTQAKLKDKLKKHLQLIKDNWQISLMCQKFLQISKKKTNNSVGKYAKDTYGDFTEIRCN